MAGQDWPLILPWDQFALRERRNHEMGQHKLFVGPTQSGKTVLARVLARDARAVVVLGTKKRDSSLDAYVAEGYKRIYHWPPTANEIKEARTPSNSIRFILWPEFDSLDSLNDDKVSEEFRKMFDSAYLEGYWTIVCDESLWLASRDGLDLGGTLVKMAYASASNNVSLYLCMQRPSGISRTTWSNVSDAYIFHMGVDNDLREMASLGTYDPKDVRQVIKALTGKYFLKLPVRAGTPWTISKVSLEALKPRKLP